MLKKQGPGLGPREEEAASKHKHKHELKLKHKHKQDQLRAGRSEAKAKQSKAKPSEAKKTRQKDAAARPRLQSNPIRVPGRACRRSCHLVPRKYPPAPAKRPEPITRIRIELIHPILAHLLSLHLACKRPAARESKRPETACD